VVAGLIGLIFYEEGHKIDESKLTLTDSNKSSSREQTRLRAPRSTSPPPKTLETAPSVAGRPLTTETARVPSSRSDPYSIDRLVLLGTFIASTKSSAIIQVLPEKDLDILPEKHLDNTGAGFSTAAHEGEGEVELLVLGDRIVGYELIEIHQERVLVQQDGSQYELQLDPARKLARVRKSADATTDRKAPRRQMDERTREEIRLERERSKLERFLTKLNNMKELPDEQEREKLAAELEKREAKAQERELKFEEEQDKIENLRARLDGEPKERKRAQIEEKIDRAEKKRNFLAERLKLDAEALEVVKGVLAK